MRLRLLAPVLVVLIAAPAPLPVSAQAPGGDPTALTIEQVQRRFRRMSPVHILKCDYNGDNLIERKEYPCVEGIYRVMYVDR